MTIAFRTYLRETIIVLGLVAISITALPAYSQQPLSSDEILHSLKMRKTRGPADAQTVKDASAIQRLKIVRKTRGLTVGERDELYNIGQRRAHVDLTIFFGFDSADITQEAIPSLNQLGAALVDPSMKGASIAIAGHTDAKGDANYNQSLSERRADAVKRYLVQFFSINADELLTTGYGASKLKNPQNPLADENRRVQIVNFGQ